MKAAVEKLSTESQELGQALYAQAGAAEAGAPGADGAEAGAQQDDGVVDAEVVDEDPKDAK